MKARFLLVLSAVPMSICANAQDSGRIQVFGGYSLVDYSVFQRYSGPTTFYKFNGWDASFMGRVAPHLGLEADFGGGFSGSYGTTGTSAIYSYMGGPRVFVDSGKARYYAHALFGGMTFTSPGAISSTSLAVAVGGGADYWFSRHIGVQVLQADYIHNNNNVLGPSHADFRISTGVVFRFGH